MEEIRWYWSLNKEDSDYSLMKNETLTERSCIVSYETEIRKFKYTKFSSPFTFQEFFNKIENKYFYEIIRGNKLL